MQICRLVTKCPRAPKVAVQLGQDVSCGQKGGFLSKLFWKGNFLSNNKV